MKIPAFLPFVAVLVYASVSLAQESPKSADEGRENLKQKIQEIDVEIKNSESEHQKLQQKLLDSSAAGKFDDEAQLARKLAAMNVRLATRREERHLLQMLNKESQGDRMQHIAEAIKHLRAAGLNEPAERIEQMAREQQKAEGKNREQAGAGEGAEPMQRAFREMQEQTQRALREMHQQTQEQMAKMARTIEELREQVAKREKRE